jgi:phospholipid-binding lipoprotein MlaA
MSSKEVVTATLALLLVAGCAQRPPHKDAADPLEPINRAIYTFNDKVDEYALKPVAEGYERVTPQPVRRSVSNFFGNLEEPIVIVNGALQGKFHQAASDSARFIFNTTFGIVGLFDVATSMGHPRHNEDFGQTFGVWGFGEGWYLVLPFLGPSTVRDTGGRLVNNQMDLVAQHEEVRERNAAIALRVVDTRAGLLGAGRVRDTAALDPYLYTREAYRQFRWNRIHDGNPPLPDFDDYD